MQIELEGKIIKALELRSGLSARTGNEWRRRDYVLETPGQYPRKCVFTVADGNIDLFNLTEGKMVKVTLSVDAHEYEGRWFNDFRAIGVADPVATQTVGGATPVGTTAPVGAQPQTPPSNAALPWE